MNKLTFYFLTHMVILLGVRAQGSVPIFRSLESPFSSGYVDKGSLKRGQVKYDSSQYWYEIVPAHSKNQKVWVKVGQVLHLSDFSYKATVREDAPLFLRPNWNEKTGELLTKGTSLVLRECKKSWCKLIKPKTAWIQRSVIDSVSTDLGYAVISKKTYFFNRSNKKIKILKPSEKCRILAIRKRQFKVLCDNQTGYVSAENTFSKLQISDFIYTTDKKWLSVIHVVGSRFETRSGQVISLENLRKAKSNSNKVILLPKSKTFSDPIGLKSVSSSPGIYIKKRSLDLIWKHSLVKRHGYIWWPELARYNEEPFSHNLALDLFGVEQKNTVTTRELVAKGIYDIATHPFISDLSLATSNGVFISRDGYNWKKIDSLGNLNFPITITNSGTILIGPYRSTDHGKTFKPYVYWDRLVYAVQSRINTHPKKLKLIDVKTSKNDPQHIILKMSIGKKKPLYLKSLDGGISWVAKFRP